MEGERNKCYNCKYRGTVPGSAHSSCKALDVDVEPHERFILAHLLGTGELKLSGPLHIDPTGIRGGWAYWPINFDPVWIVGCKLFKSKINEEE